VFVLTHFFPLFVFNEYLSRGFQESIPSMFRMLLAHFCIVVILYSLLRLYFDVNLAIFCIGLYFLFSLLFCIFAYTYQRNMIHSKIKEINDRFGTDFKATNSLGQKFFINEDKEKILVIDNSYVRCEHKSFLVGYSLCYVRNKKTRIQLLLNDESHPSVNIDVESDLIKSFKWIKRLGDLIGAKEIKPCNISLEIKK